MRVKSEKIFIGSAAATFLLLGCAVQSQAEYPLSPGENQYLPWGTYGPCHSYPDPMLRTRGVHVIESGRSLANVPTNGIDVLECRPYDGDGGTFVVDCGGRDYSYCLLNRNDGRGNHVMLGVRTDDDHDGIPDTQDNCPAVANADQQDTDHDGQGDLCDDDLDGDGLANGTDNCPNVANASQSDYDGDSAGDACDDDVDGDGVANGSDVCAFTELNAVVNPAEGCSIAQLCPCEGPRGTTGLWKNHGGYVSCVAKSAESFVGLNLITEAEKDMTVSAAAQSACGKK